MVNTIRMHPDVSSTAEQLRLRPEPAAGWAVRLGGVLVLALVAIVILGSQNVSMLWRHYFRDEIVPWDFVATYHAVPFYWIEAVRAGASSAWVPFQALGYPLYLNAQSGYNYPGFWWYVLAGSSYDYNAAVVFQGLHILLGGLGACLCARLMGTRWSTALFAGVAFQAFGAFFSNASHPDIVRAHALAPWVLMPVVACWRSGRSYDLSVLALPLWVFALWTGGYVGAAMAVSFAALLVMVGRFIAAAPHARRVGVWALAAFGVGMVLAGVFLGPMALDRGEVERAASGHRFAVEYLNARDLLAVALRVDDNKWFGHDVTMRSMSLALPVLLLLLCRPFAGRLRWACVPLSLVLIAFAMSTAPVHAAIAALVPPLGYSRFPLSDYRGILGLGLVLLAAQTLDRLQAQGLMIRRRACLLVMAAASIGLVLITAWWVYPEVAWNTRSPLALLVCATLALALVAALLLKLPAASPRARAWLIAALLVFTALDWHRVHGNAGYLFGPGAALVAQRHLGSSLEQARAGLQRRLSDPPPCRPARTVVPESDFMRTPWRGYYTGDYMSHDYSGPMKFVRHQQILGQTDLSAFALEPWKAVAVPTSSIPAPSELRSLAPAGMQCVRYGTDELHYRVQLTQPTRVVENEVFWRGWAAVALGQRVEPVSVHGLRAWDLPAGSYDMVVRFTAPHRAVAGGLLAAGLLGWCLLMLFLWRTRQWR
jgi:hypothetical protein